MGNHSRTVLAVLLSLLLNRAYAQDRTFSIYGDWTVSCAAASAGKSCGVVQVQKAQNQQSPLSQIGIGRSATGQSFKISIETRSDVWIPSGVKLLTDDNQFEISASFKWCIATRCLADGDLGDADIQKLRVQRALGHLVYKSAPQADILIPVSFKGFSEAIGALQKQ
jgi:invasion protein IalB